MMKNSTHIGLQASFAVLSGIIGLLLAYLIGYRWAEGGFEPMALALYTVVPALLIFACIATLNTIGLIRYYRICSEEIEPRWAWWKAVLIGWAAVVVGTLGFDAFYFYVLDDSLPQAFAQAIMDLSQREGDPQPQSVADAFASLPLFAQGIFLNLIATLLGTLFSVGLSRAVWSRVYAQPENAYAHA